MENVPAKQPVQVELATAPEDVENVPGQHSMQFAENAMLVPVWYVPAWQLVQAVDLDGENWPAGQAVHALTGPTPNVPAGQDVQLLAPASENVPLVQNWQTVAPGMFAGKEYMPAAQASHVVFRPRLVENVPGAQSSQSTSVVVEQALQPGNRLYLPAEQRMQGPPGGPHLPGTHEQLSRSQAKAGENVPSLHWACTPPKQNVGLWHATHGVLFTPFQPKSQ